MPSESSGPGADPFPTPHPLTPLSHPLVQTSAQRRAALPFRPRKGTSDTFPQELIKGLLSVTLSGIPVNVLSVCPLWQSRENQATVVETFRGCWETRRKPRLLFSPQTQRRPSGLRVQKGAVGEASPGARNPEANTGGLAFSQEDRILVLSKGIHITCE